MSLGTILLIVLVLLLIGAIPSWPHSRGWGYGPSGGLGLVVLMLLFDAKRTVPIPPKSFQSQTFSQLQQKSLRWLRRWEQSLLQSRHC